MTQFFLFVNAVLFLILPVLNPTATRIDVKNEKSISDNFQKLSGFSQLQDNTISYKIPEAISPGNNIKNSNANWFDKTISALSNEEYNISYIDDLKSYQSPNRANNIRFIYHSNGFTAGTRESKISLNNKYNDKIERSLTGENEKYEVIPEWETNFILKGLTNNVSDDLNNLTLFAGKDLAVNGNKASVEDANMRIDYENNEQGMRQDFVVKNRTNGFGDLKLMMSVKSNLEINVSKDAIVFLDTRGKKMMEYAALKVWDANGKELKAYFQPSSMEIKSTDNIILMIPENENQFCIVVEDKYAVYPVTVDPTSTSPNWATESNQPQSGYGYSVSSAGDVNNDGYSDVIIGALFYDNGQTDEGKAFVYLGSSAGLLPVAAWTAEGNQQDAQFANSVASAGDINNDGYSDVIIGASIYDNDQVDEGRVYVYYGSAIGLSLTPNWIAESNFAGSQFGWSVSTAGDVNNDGYSDIIIGAPLYSNGQTYEGRAFVYHGSAAGLSVTANWTGECNQASGFYGYSVCCAGDVNGDGYSDILIGANTYDNPRRDEGKVYLYKGTATGVTVSMTWTPTTIASYFANFGASVSSAGDVNGDGYSDVIVGAYSFDNSETDEGKVYVYHGSPAGLSLTPNWVMESNQSYAHFGHCVSSAGDFNNDGYSDVIVGARNYDHGEVNEGSAFIYLGTPGGLSPIVNLTLENDQTEEYFGISVSEAGDVNGDGFDDVIMGAYLYDNGQADEGGAFVYHGSAISVKTLSLRTTLQGFYNTTTNLSILDTVRVYLKNAAAPYTNVDSAKSVINSSGLAIFSFANATNGVNYFIHVKHRNSIATWSKTPQSFISSALSYDFSTANTQAYGNNMVQVDASPVKFAIYCGDSNQDGVVDGSDTQLIDNDATVFLTGYQKTDLNGDGIVDGADLVLGENNSANFVSSVTP
ncbi:MAG: FG-GAP-like repeat-containing protein [Ignavibacteria bacterium]